MRTLFAIMWSLVVSVCGMFDAGARKYEKLYFRLVAKADDADNGEQLTEAEKALYTAALFDMEIQNGGICQFLVNCEPALAIRVSQSMRKIGLEEMAEAYDAFVRKYGIDVGNLAEFKVQSAEEYAELCRKYPYGEFDETYMKLRKKLRFTRTMLKYAETE